MLKRTRVKIRKLSKNVSYLDQIEVNFDLLYPFVIRIVLEEADRTIDLRRDNMTVGVHAAQVIEIVPDGCFNRISRCASGIFPHYDATPKTMTSSIHHEVQKVDHLHQLVLPSSWEACDI